MRSWWAKRASSYAKGFHWIGSGRVLLFEALIRALGSEMMSYLTVVGRLCALTWLATGCGLEAKGAASAISGPAVESRASLQDVTPYSAVAADDWTRLFDRTSGWTGADGVYTIPISGDERRGSGANGTTLWWFNDTFIGGVTPQGSRTAGSTIVNNAIAMLQGDQPDSTKMQFIWSTTGGGAPRARIIPNTSSQHWFWPNDGMVVGTKYVLFSLRMKPGGTPPFAFATDGISILSDNVSNPTPFSTYKQAVAPLYLPAAGGHGEVIFGQALMPNTAAAGAPFADGYVYIYGLRNDFSKKLLVARVKPKDIGTFSRYRFWDGATWNTQIASAVPLTNRMSSEFSVTPLADGRYLMVFQLDALGADIAVRYGASPVGPWDAPIPIWHCPEITLTPNILVYGAKAHPHLSQPGELLISYHVNTTVFAEHFQFADIYRPRFVRLPLP